MNIGIWEILLILVVVLIIFGAGKLPRVMGDLGKGIRSFQREMKGMEDSAPDPGTPDPDGSPPAAATPPAATPPAATPLVATPVVATPVVAPVVAPVSAGSAAPPPPA